MSINRSITIKILDNPELRFYIVRLDGYGNKRMQAKSLGHLMKDLQYLKDQGLTLTILCEDKRKAG